MKTNSLEKRIAKMKRGESFIVNSEAERQRASKFALGLKRAGIVEFRLDTEECELEPGKFTVSAIYPPKSP